MAAEMRLYRHLIFGCLVALGCMLAHAVPFAASTTDRPEDLPLRSWQPASADSRYAGRLAGAWAQGVALTSTDAQPSAMDDTHDEGPVLHRMRQSIGAVSERAAGILSRPAPRLGGLVLVLLTAFALVLGFLSLRWHRETAE